LDRGLNGVDVEQPRTHRDHDKIRVPDRLGHGSFRVGWRVDQDPFSPGAPCLRQSGRKMLGANMEPKIL
jgi:hypothetical protein